MDGIYIFGYDFRFNGIFYWATRALDDMWREFYVEVIKGDKSVDEFDAFVQRYNDAGGLDRLAEAQEAYDAADSLLQYVPN